MAALVDTSEPNRSSDSEKCRLAFFCMVGRSMTPSLRTAAMSLGSSMPASFMAWQVRSMARPTPVSPTNMWCASSVSMKRQVRDSGSKPDCARLSSCILPSRSVKKVNMKNESQSGVSSLKAPSMRGLSASPERRLQQLVGLLAAVLAEILVQQVDHGPQVPAFLDVDLEQVAHVVERGRGLAEVALLLDARGLRVALDDDQAAQHGAVLARHLLPGRARPCGRRS